MALTLTSKQIINLIDDLKKAEPYTFSEMKAIPLDATSEEYDELRCQSTRIKRILDGYFKQHPEEDIYGYSDGSCFK